MSRIQEKISIIMPAYNEAGRIESSVKETIETFQNFSSSFELIVIDDGSTDNTSQLLLWLALRYPEYLVVKKNLVNFGKGQAVKKALRYATGDYVVFLDADMDLHPMQVEALFNIMQLSGADIIIGSKLHPNSRVNYPLDRKIISFIYYLLIRLLFNLPCHDTQTGLKLFKAGVLHRVFRRVTVKKFAFDLEVLVNANHLGYKITEAPIVLNPRRRFSRIGPMAIYTTFLDTLAIFYRLKILKYYDRIDCCRGKNLAG